MKYEQETPADLESHVDFLYITAKRWWDVPYVSRSLHNDTPNCCPLVRGSSNLGPGRNRSTVPQRLPTPLCQDNGIHLRSEAIHLRIPVLLPGSDCLRCYAGAVFDLLNVFAACHLLSGFLDRRSYERLGLFFCLQLIIEFTILFMVFLSMTVCWTKSDSKFLAIVIKQFFIFILVSRPGSF